VTAGRRILGIDPGTVVLGYGVIEGDPPYLVAYGVISAPRRLSLEQRLHRIYQGLEEVVNRYRPGEIAVEEPFVSRNPRSALAVGRVQGLALMAAARAGVPVYRYSPAEIKGKVTGYGSGDKSQVQEMVRLHLGLDAPPEPSDAADALAVALCHCYSAPALLDI